MPIYQAKGKKHIQFISQMAYRIWKERGYARGLFNTCIRESLKLHREYLMKFPAEEGKSNIEPLIQPQIVGPVGVNSNGGSYYREGNQWICLKNNRGA